MATYICICCEEPHDDEERHAVYANRRTGKKFPNSLICEKCMKDSVYDDEAEFSDIPELEPWS